MPGTQLKHQRTQYKVTTIEKSTMPEGGSVGDWHRYVIENEASKIVGYHMGSKQEVMVYADEFVEQLNSRNTREIRTHWTSRKKQ